MMNIIKIGGSIIIPNEQYDPIVIKNLLDLVKKSKEKFIFVIGGGKLNQNILQQTEDLLEKSLPASEIAYARDSLGIAATKMNAHHLLQEFRKTLGKEVHPEILLDPTKNIKSAARIFFIGGLKPGHSTDQDMMLLAQTYHAERVIKVSNFDIVKKINPVLFSKLSEEQKKHALAEAPDLPRMTWQELKNVVGTVWIPRLNTPFDPRAVETGMKLHKKVILYIGRYQELPKILAGKPFKGTVVKG